MLCRVAESLYWMARYLERAEDVARLLDVNFHALLDGRSGRTAAQSWQQLVARARRRGRLPRALRGVHGGERERLGAAGTAATRARSSSCIDARARERALGARADLGRDVGGDQQAVPARAQLRPQRARGRAALAVRRAAQLRAPLPGRGRRDDGARRGVRVHPARAAPGAGREDDAHRRRALPGGGGAGRERPVPPAGARRSAALVQRVRVVRAPARHVVRAGAGRGRARALARLAAFGAALRRQLPRRRRADRQRQPRAAPAARPARGRPRVRGARSTCRGRAWGSAMARLLVGINSVGESITKAYFASRAVPIAAITAQEVQQQQCG